jgi:hypothetical protein
MNLSVSVATNTSISFDEGNFAEDSGTGVASRMPPTRVHSFHSEGALMRARHFIAVAFILVLVGVKLTFLAVPIAAADARSSVGGSVDVFQIHHTVGTLPLQNVHDTSFVFPSPAP